MYVPVMFVLVPDLTWSEGKERKEGKGAGRKKRRIFINSRKVTQTRTAAYLNTYNISSVCAVGIGLSGCVSVPLSPRHPHLLE